ncbi:hypothetical protein SKAU_G00238860 [Synaphobranchus kaupii]|uniref:Nucleotidyl transferase domain-containing protein n=1 Tax=Synaphobranchus kaupii TaxID=118154 RepID=A0A9Q1F7C6_SYNKA|nr:hypothetical protein SKAU_G00238860 [Synaphobranchus kaupii]
MSEAELQGMENSAQDVEGPKASREALEFLDSIDLKELQHCLFSDALLTVSDTGRELGEFTITVQNANYDSQPCYHVHANSHGSIDNIPCGTSVTAYISTKLETLEQSHHEYVTLQDHLLDRKSQMVRRGDQLLVNKVVTEREDVKRQTITFPLSSLEGFVSEASNLLIQRILAQQKRIPENMVFLTLDTETNITLSTYKGLGQKQQMVGQECMEVFGIERTVDSIEDVPAAWHCYFLSDGHLASRVQVGSPVTMRLTQVPLQMGGDDKDKKAVFEKKPLVWEEDMQLCSKFLDTKEALKADHASYVRQHPDLKALLADFLQFLLLRKPDDIREKREDYDELVTQEYLTTIFTQDLQCITCSGPVITMLKTVILIGGPQKGTRFRPLSFEVPKPLFPVAGVPMLQHHIEACAKVPNMKEILLIGFYQPNEELTRFLSCAQQEFKIPIRYLQEYAALGTGGGIYHFRDQILSGGPDAFFIMNADVCSEFPLPDMLDFQKEHGDTHNFVILGTTANRKQSMNYGCIVENQQTHEVLHYVEKPSTFVSDIINCGIYLFTPEIFQHIGTVFQKNQQDMLLEEQTNGWHRAEVIRLEQDIFTALAGQGKLYVYKTNRFWSQIKSAGSAIYASRLYLNQYHKTHPERLATNEDGGPKISGNVYIHPTANIDPTAVLGPNVSIGTGVTIGAGVRVRESIILHGATLQDHSCVLNSIVGWDSIIGKWARVEGTPSDPNPNDPYAKIDSETLFREGKLTPSITILGCNVNIPSEVIILNSIVLPHKDLNRSFKNQIIL